MVFCPLASEGILPLTRCHEYPCTLEDVALQVNVTSFNAGTVELVGLAVTPVIKTFIIHVYQK